MQKCYALFKQKCYLILSLIAVWNKKQKVQDKNYLAVFIWFRGNVVISIALYDDSIDERESLKSMLFYIKNNELEWNFRIVTNESG